MKSVLLQLYVLTELKFHDLLTCTKILSPFFFVKLLGCSLYFLLDADIFFEEPGESSVLIICIAQSSYGSFL